MGAFFGRALERFHVAVEIAEAGAGVGGVRFETDGFVTWLFLFENRFRLSALVGGRTVAGALIRLGVVDLCDWGYRVLTEFLGGGHLETRCDGGPCIVV